MLCFKFYKEGDISINLCEEIIRYSAYREDGIYIGVVMIVKTESPNSSLLAIHRRSLVGLKIIKVSDMDCFPYLFIFAKLRNLRLNEEGHGFIPLSKEGMLIPPETTLFNFDDEKKFNFYDCSTQIPKKLKSYAPFTCLRIGPFPDAPGTYIFAYECKIEDPTFGDLVFEDNESITRRYKVYGPTHIHREIRAIDLPKAIDISEAFIEYAEYYNKILKMVQAVPKQYSIVAIDNPNCNPDRLRCVTMSSNLKDQTKQICDDIYKNPILGSIKNRVYWFVCEQPSDDFFLHLSGPIAFSCRV